MENFKIEAKENAKEIIGLIKETGCRLVVDESVYLDEIDSGCTHFVCSNHGAFSKMNPDMYEVKEITLPELRQLAGRKSINDQYAEIEGVRQSMVKEYLDSNYVLREVKQTSGDNRAPSDWIEIPEGAEFAVSDGKDIEFRKSDKYFVGHYWCGAYYSFSDFPVNDWSVIWSRHTQPDELPFIDDEPKHAPNATESRTLNDNVNNPSHYTQGGIECIEAIKAALTDDEFKGFCKGNSIKYLWRTNHKNGLEDLKKSRWYLDRLIGELSE